MNVSHKHSCPDNYDVRGMVIITADYRWNLIAHRYYRPAQSREFNDKWSAFFAMLWGKYYKFLHKENINEIAGFFSIAETATQEPNESN